MAFSSFAQSPSSISLAQLPEMPQTTELIDSNEFEHSDSEPLTESDQSTQSIPQQQSDPLLIEPLPQSYLLLEEPSLSALLSVEPIVESKKIPIPSELYIHEVDQKVYDNIVIDEYSLDLIEKGNNGQRYAGIGFIDVDDCQLTLYCRPSFEGGPLNETEDEKESRIQSQTQRKKFSPEDCVEGIQGQTGIVHHNLIQAIRLYFYRKEKYVPHLKSVFVIGFSFYKTSSNILNFTVRSTLNYTVSKVNPVAAACYHFELDKSDFTRPIYLSIYHLDRTLDLKVYNKIQLAFNNRLLEKHSLKEIPPAELLSKPSPHQDYSCLEEWRKIYTDKEKIAKYMMQTIYFASRLEDKISVSTAFNPPFQPTNSEVISSVIDTAKEYGLSLNIDYIPETMKTDMSSSALDLLAQRGDLDSVIKLIDYQKYLNIKQSTRHQEEVIEILGQSLLNYVASPANTNVEKINKILERIKYTLKIILPGQIEKQNQRLSKMINYGISEQIGMISQSMLFFATLHSDINLLNLFMENSITTHLEDHFELAIRCNRTNVVKAMIEKNNELLIFLNKNMLNHIVKFGNLDLFNLYSDKVIGLSEEDRHVMKKNCYISCMKLFLTNSKFLQFQSLLTDYIDTFKIDFNATPFDIESDLSIGFEPVITCDDTDKLNEFIKIFPDRYNQIINEEKPVKNILFQTIKNDANNVLNIILESKVNLEIKNLTNETPLLFAARLLNLKAIAILLKAGADKEAKNANNLTYVDCLQQHIFRLVHEGRYKLISQIFTECPETLNTFPKEKLKMVKQGLNKILEYHYDNRHFDDVILFCNLFPEIMNIFLKNRWNDIAISLIYQNNIPLLTFFLQKNINIEIVFDHINQQYHTLLMHAATMGRLKIIDLLIEAGADINVKINGITASRCLNKSLDRSTIMKLEEKHPGLYLDPSARLRDAIIYDNDVLFDELVETKIDLETRYPTGETPLLMAALRGRISVMEKLIEKNAKKDAINDRAFNFETCLNYGAIQLAKQGKFSELKNISTKYPFVNVNFFNEYKETVSSIIFLNLRENYLSSLIISGRTNIHELLNQQFPELFKIVMSMEDQSNDTLLILAVKNKIIWLVDALLKLKVNPLAKNSLGLSALTLALESKDTYLVDLFINNLSFPVILRSYIDSNNPVVLRSIKNCYPDDFKKCMETHADLLLAVAKNDDFETMLFFTENVREFLEIKLNDKETRQRIKCEQIVAAFKPKEWLIWRLPVYKKIYQAADDEFKDALSAFVNIDKAILIISQPIMQQFRSSYRGNHYELYCEYLQKPKIVTETVLLLAQEALEKTPTNNEFVLQMSKKNLQSSLNEIMKNITLEKENSLELASRLG